ncbi:uncharacterized protein IUM83_04935 [Phytophthora cinnamomi]|uniref:uncharacterized protein n=1 Tax=Phytophthora cinnamomi TaxID=4785 RepID=UPI00355AC548|nr:hypothetical protein IUM83_04935 [Phytophthora cinnamomi]
MEERRSRERNWSMQVIALYDYEPEQSDELGFREGDVLRVLRVQDDGWWSGYNVEIPGVVGVFPSNYVQAQRGVVRQQSTKMLVDAVTTPRPPASARQRIQQQPRQTPDTPELEDEDDDMVPELRSEFRGHIGTVLQLRKNLEEAERATHAVRDARRQAERDRLRHSKSWRERDDDEMDEEGQGDQYYSRRRQQEEVKYLENEEDTEDDDDESAYPQQQGHMHERAEEGAEEVDLEKTTEDEEAREEEENNTHTDAEVEQPNTTFEAENAAATLIARNYRRHNVVIQEKYARERRDEQQKLSEIAAVCIQRWATHAYSRQRKRRQRELEQSTARRRWERENQAAIDIQKWIRLRWACFWRRRVQIEREKRTAMGVQQNPQREQQENDKQRQVDEDENHSQRVEEEAVQDSAEAEEQQEQGRISQQRDVEDEREQRQQLQLKAAEEEVQRRFAEVAEQEYEGDQRDIDPAVPSPSPQVRSPDKPRRKVMKKEAVELIKSLVQQQLGETLRDHDAKMEELQRMVARLQTVVRKQTAMLEDSTDQLVSLRMGQNERKIPFATTEQRRRE